MPHSRPLAQGTHNGLDHFLHLGGEQIGACEVAGYGSVLAGYEVAGFVPALVRLLMDSSTVADEVREVAGMIDRGSVVPMYPKLDKLLR